MRRLAEDLCEAAFAAVAAFSPQADAKAVLEAFRSSNEASFRCSGLKETLKDIDHN